MLERIKDFVGKNKIWFIIGGIIFAVAGAVLACLVSLYFLIAVAVGVIVAFVSGLNNQSLEKYKEKARSKITKEYILKLCGMDNEPEDIDKIEVKNTCSILIQKNGSSFFIDDRILRLLKKHFRTIDLSDCSLTKIRGDIEVFFEVLTGVNYSNAREGQRYEFQINGVWQLTTSEGLDGFCSAMSVSGALKCFFEHTILCASTIYKYKKYHNLYRNALLFDKNLSITDFCQKQLNQPFPITGFEVWEQNHTHSKVL